MNNFVIKKWIAQINAVIRIKILYIHEKYKKLDFYLKLCTTLWNYIVLK